MRKLIESKRVGLLATRTKHQSKADLYGQSMYKALCGKALQESQSPSV